LHDAKTDQCPERWRQPAGGRSGGEDDEAVEVDELVAVGVSQATDRDQQHRERDQVRQ
jgi:hypothetical protein